ncbi:hypothetical protein AB0B25_17825 [Nocardia sp. NPDC049190]|uniref:hypothetical protein n=1 Tax=Nocardia sp. NPDC049190 TaxID=3155650 RepID=UPI0034023886
MIGRHVHIGRLLTIAVIAGTLASIVACGTNSPEEQADRERKAASVTTFKLHMTKDLWTRTSSDRSTAADGRKVEKPKNITEDPNGMATIELTGPQMVDYLQILDYNAHGGSTARDEPLARAVYDTLASVVDRIQTPPAPGTAEPEITINAAVGPGTSSVATPTTSTAPK